jgi:phosphatidylserine/phosphatidylglycerophosphate/cardiolipin synthase-like enzyme
MWASRFGNKRPDKVGDAGWKWLSRGLNEALLAFIGQARGSRFGLRVAAYQFVEENVLAALKAASDSGADVRIVYDARNEDIAKPNRAAVEAAGIGDLCKERTVTPGPIMHNKFIVLLDRKSPAAVWTGSTNITTGGIFGHSNVGHSVRSKDVAAVYLHYWELLEQDLQAPDMRDQVEQLTPTPAAGSDPPNGVSVQFSPRSGIALLKWYVEQAASARDLMCSTFAFGINKQFVPMFSAPMGGLRYAMLDSPGASAGAKDQVLALRKLPFNRFAIGNLLRLNMFDKWLAEKLSGLNRHARFIHTKFMLVDPLGPDPVVISGSANFSDASTNANDENMLVIRGNRSVADIYLTEYMRLWNHYAFREWAASLKPGTEAKPQFLKTDDSWRTGYFGDTERSRQRRIFAGVTA